MGGILVFVVWLLCVYLLVKSEQKDKERAEKRRFALERCENTKQRRTAPQHFNDGARRVPSSAVSFRNPEQKAVAFDTFISWARQEARANGVSWSSLEGRNDYQRARQIFQGTKKWKQLRQSTLARYPRCLSCGTTQDLQIDHVVPMVRRPDMFNHESNLQTLCGPCNRQKGVSIIDYRPVQKAPPKPERSPPMPKRSPRKPWRSEAKIVAIRDGIPVFSRYGDGPTDKQKEILSVLSLSPEERRQHNKRVAQELKAERLAAQKARQAEK